MSRGKDALESASMFVFVALVYVFFGTGLLAGIVLFLRLMLDPSSLGVPVMIGEQTDLFGAAEREEAIDKAEVGAEGWVEKIGLTLLYHLAMSLKEIQSADVEAMLEIKNLPHPNEPRAYGALFREAKRRGWLKPTDVHRPTRHEKIAKRNHRRPMRVWEVVHQKLPRTSEGI